MEYSIAPVRRIAPDRREEARQPERPSSARCDVLSVAYFPCLADAQETPACNEIEIIIPGENAAFQVAHRGARDCDRAVVAHGDHVTVIPAGQPHTLHPMHGGDGPGLSDSILISLDSGFFEEKALEAGISDAPRLDKRFNAVDPFMRALGSELRSEFFMQRPPSRTYLEPLAAVIAIHLALYYCRAAAPRSREGLRPDKLARVKAYIREHLAESLRVQRLAAAVHLSAFHFARLFKEATGQPPHVYLTFKRIEYAKHLLQYGALPLSEIAARAGFQTQGHFTVVFHRYTGMTPRAFRLSSRPPD